MKNLGMMVQSPWICVFAAALSLASLSCNGTGEGLASVTGKVMCNGQPAAGAVLILQRQSGSDAPPAAAAAVIPSAVVGDDGGFTVESHPLGQGAAPGKYAVLVRWPEEPPTEAPAERPKTTKVKGKTVVVKAEKGIGEGRDRLDGRYMNAAKPLFQAEVKPGTNDLGSLELDLKK